MTVPGDRSRGVSDDPTHVLPRGDAPVTVERRAGTLVSVNVGLPQDITWQGRTVRTGVWKHPVNGPRMVRRLNVDGDGQGDLAGHGGEQRAVLVYQLDSYRYWQAHLGRDDVEPGQFGENFTVDGLPDDQVCIGDRYRIGSAVFEVTQPRVTCYRVGIRMAEPRLPALLVSHHRPGFYLRVLQEGQVSAGDDIVQVARGPQRMTVAEADALLYLPGHARDAIARALRIPALSPGWRASFTAMLEQDGQAGSGNAGLTTTAPAPAWAGFRPLRVVRTRRESRSVLSVTLASEDDRPLPAGLPGQFLTLSLPVDPSGAPVLRSYSLSGPPTAGRYRISVKEEPGGVASGYLHGTVRVGDVLDVAAPRGGFTLRPGRSPVLLISAGVGATPVLAMLQALVATRSSRHVWWLHGARDGADHVFAAESAALVAALPNGHRHICLSRPGPLDRAGRDYDTPGRLSSSVLAGLDLPRGAEAYLCGPAGFPATISAALVALGAEPSRIHVEVFGPTPAGAPGIVDAIARPAHRPAGPVGDGPAVSFARSNLSVPWDSTKASLLDLAEACDVPTRWSCRTGVCHTCETGLLSGDVAYAPEPVEPPARGNLLLCCARPVGPVTLDL